MIRPTSPSDTPRLIEISRDTGVFKPAEIDVLGEVLRDYHAGDAAADGHVAATSERDGEILGYVYYGPAGMTDRTWYLHWIAVARHDQSKGAGSALLHHAENDVQKRGGRVLFIETSSLPEYEAARRFYRKHGYEVQGVLRDYYRDGDDMVVFRKRLGA